jgi:pimeloyl-ACP methyl ester carboxylesterase
MFVKSAACVFLRVTNFMSTRNRVFHKDTLVVGRFEVPFAIGGSGRRTLVCVNGMQQTMAVWSSLVKRMAPAGYRTVLFDFPHQGRAAALGTEGSLTVHEQMEVLDAVVCSVSPLAPVALIGGSWGAIVSAAYAATHPQRVSRLVLGGFQTTPNARLQQIARRGRILIEQGRGPELAALFVEQFGAGIDATRRAAMEAQFRGLRPEQFRQMYDSGTLLVERVDFESMYDVGRITARTLIINGGADPLIDSERTPRTAARFRTAAWHVEPGVGHFLHYERPALLDVYARFLTDACESHAEPPDGRTAAPGCALHASA